MQRRAIDIHVSIVKHCCWSNIRLPLLRIDHRLVAGLPHSAANPSSRSRPTRDRLSFLPNGNRDRHSVSRSSFRISYRRFQRNAAFRRLPVNKTGIRLSGWIVPASLQRGKTGRPGRQLADCGRVDSSVPRYGQNVARGIVKSPERLGSAPSTAAI